jgi:hypothetical protein
MSPGSRFCFALLGVFTKQSRVEPLGENTKRGSKVEMVEEGVEF